MSVDLIGEKNQVILEFTVTYRTVTVNVITVHTVRYDVFGVPSAFTRYAMFNRIKYEIFRMVHSIRYDGNVMNT